MAGRAFGRRRRGSAVRVGRGGRGWSGGGGTGRGMRLRRGQGRRSLRVQIGSQHRNGGEGGRLTFPKVGECRFEHDGIDLEHLVEMGEGLVDGLIAPGLEGAGVDGEKGGAEGSWDSDWPREDKRCQRSGRSCGKPRCGKAKWTHRARGLPRARLRGTFCWRGGGLQLDR